MAERRELVERLEDLMRLATDIRMALDFMDRLDETGGVVDLVAFGDGESVFTTLSQADLAQIDTRISRMLGELVAKANRLRRA